VRKKRKLEEQLTAPRFGWLGHIVDVIFFRILGVALLYHETKIVETADKWLVGAGVFMFFVPDWLRGRDSLPARALQAWLERRSG
jgi:uncharacterized membrane protein YhhN